MPVDDSEGTMIVEELSDVLSNAQKDELAVSLVPLSGDEPFFP